MSTSTSSTAQTASTSSVDLPTLAITAIASASAAYVCSQIWAPGTLASAALMPVLVALLREGLARPTYAVTRAVPVRGTVRSARSVDPSAAPAADAPDERVAQSGEVRGESRSPRRRAWRSAVLTGLLGFLVAAVIITGPEFVAGQAASGGDRATTLFGGQPSSPTPATTQTTTTPTDTTTTPATTPTETVTVPPETTVTVPPAQTTTVPPVETVPPVQTTPVQPPPGTTTPVPPG